MQKIPYFLYWVLGTFFSVIVFAQEPAYDSTQNSLHQLHIRSLSASCAACHGSQGNPINDGATNDKRIPPLAGINKTDFIQKIQDFREGKRRSTIMHHHAIGLTAQEITSLAEYFSMQSRHDPHPIPTQSLLPSHAH